MKYNRLDALLFGVIAFIIAVLALFYATWKECPQKKSINPIAPAQVQKSATNECKLLT